MGQYLYHNFCQLWHYSAFGVASLPSVKLRLSFLCAALVASMLLSMSSASSVVATEQLLEDFADSQRSSSPNLFSGHFTKTKTLHVPPANYQMQEGFQIINLSSQNPQKSDLSKLIDRNYLSFKKHWRTRRAANEVDPRNLTTVVSLNDSHTTLLVHWAGKGSDVIFALAKSAIQASSSLFISRDYGKSFLNVNSQLQINATTSAVISNYYSSKVSNSRYVLTDEINRCVITTVDNGLTFLHHCFLPFVPRVVKLNLVNQELICALDDQSELKQLYVSEDFGFTWRAVYSHVRSFHWGIPPVDLPTTVFIVEELPAAPGQPEGKLQVIKSSSLFRYNYESTVLLTDVIDFEIQDDYMYATKSVNLLGATHNPNIQLWVSYKGAPFVRAEFPGDKVFTDFYVADASEGQLMVCAYINNSYTNLYVSDVNGYKFSLSLERIVYFNSKTIPNHRWFRLYGNETFADITKLHGVSGIYIASQQITDSLQVEEQQSLITFDKGGSWQLIGAPEYSISNRPSNCNISNNCSLHLTQQFHKLYPGAQTSAILSQRSSPGLVIASGFMGKSLKGDPDVFVSTNAGITWRQVLSGNYLYATADHGGIIVAAHKFFPVDEIVYSLDEGESWHSYKIVQYPIQFYGLLTEPGENSTVFSLFGSAMGPHSWQIIQIDFKPLFNAKCGPSDYKMWSVNLDLPSQHGCLLGRVTLYQRRIAHAFCYNGDDFVRVTEDTNCTCKRDDFECDFGFFNNHGTCQRDMSIKDADVYVVPAICPPGSFYSYSRGYRKVAGDTCVGGEEHRLGPLQYSCPIQERSEFLLVTTPDKVSMIDLASGRQVDLLDEQVARVPAVFDYQKNCAIYVDVAGDIKRQCFAAANASSILSHEIIHRKRPGRDVVSMAWDWTGRNIFYTDTNNTISVVNVDGRFERELYTEDHRLHSPSQILVDPHHGYLYFIGANSSSQTFAIYRAAMDGSSQNVEPLITDFVSSDTTMTFDLDSEAIYWIYPSSKSGYRVEVTGHNATLLFTEPRSFNDPSGIGVYKNDLYISTRSGFAVIMTNKHNPSLWHYFTFISSVSGMMVVSNSSQHATSACSSNNGGCSQLCLPNPHNRTCLCGAGYSWIRTGLSRDETCRCSSGEIMLNNHTCIKANNASSCAANKFTCLNGNCVQMTWKCDGEDDCGDGSDEIDCAFSTCNSLSFTCRSGKCIPKQWVCDQQDDCRDGFESDELSCGNRSCNDSQFRCNNGYCIPKSWRCDMDTDCQDQSDEQNCSSLNATCPPWSFTCHNGDCVDSSFKCNGHADCSDGSDEWPDACNHHISNCSLDWQFDCGNGHCIFPFWQCDGEDDCANGTDEINCTFGSTLPPASTTKSSGCSSDSYKCRNNFCIGWEDVCNGINDCGDYSDETNCHYVINTTTPEPSHWCDYDHFLCSVNHLCLHESKKCNGQEDCPDGTDEENCACPNEFYQCEHGKCVPRSWQCDGSPDCPMGDDERICGNETEECGHDEFTCEDGGGCISMSQHCNTEVDCLDASDESECDYQKAVNCSNFNNFKDICCSYIQCGVFIQTGNFMEGGQCMSTSEAHGLGHINRCEDIVPEAYDCKPGQFKCGDIGRSCVSFVQICDLQEDCKNGLDEQSCSDCSLFRDLGSASHRETNTTVTWKTALNFTQLSYAPLVPHASLADLTWTNLSFSQLRSSSFSVQGLQPHTKYHFSFLKISRGAICVLDSHEVITEDGIATPPQNLTTKVHAEVTVTNEGDSLTYEVELQWAKPTVTNGDIIAYRIYYQNKATTGKPPLLLSQTREVTQLERTMQTFRYTVRDNIHPLTKYEFWVGAITKAGESVPSQKSEVEIQPYENLAVTVSEIKETSLTLSWKKAAQATSYKVTVRFPEVVFPAAAISDMVLNVNSSQTSVVVDKLCPGSPVYLGVQAIYTSKEQGPVFHPNSASGEHGHINLKGIQPMANFTAVEQVEPGSVLLRYRLTSGNTAQQFYIYYTYDENIAPQVLRSEQASSELVGLFACQKYLTWIRPAFPTCPYTDLRDIYTSADDRAPPKNMNAIISRQLQHYSLTLRWSTSCSQNASILVSYIVRIRSSNGNNMNLKTSKLSIDLPYVLDGTNYTFFLRTDRPGAQETAPYTVFIPYLDQPYNWKNMAHQKTVNISWEFPPADDPVNAFKQFEVQLTSDHFESTNYTIYKNISFSLPQYGKYQVKVTAQSQTSHVIGVPGQWNFQVNDEVKDGGNAEVISISKTNLVVILVPVAAAIVALSAGLVFFIVRHKRLQRSFLAFANSHYNIQSGTTTFSEDLGLDGDEPLIQGFSDDEPLVIA